MPKRMYAAGLDPAASEPDLAPSTSSAAESAALEELRVTSIREQWTECSCGAPLEHHELPARVFGTSAIDEVTLVEASCTECGVRAAVDGSEYFILRKGPFSSAPLGTFELCFSWELLNDTMNDLAAEGTFFWTRWKACMKKWDGIDVTAAQLVGWHSLYRHFVTATLDFVTLQALDYKSVLSCKCSGAAATHADFTVYVDAERKFQKLKLRKDEFTHLDIAIPSTAKTLTLIATDGGDGIGSDLLFLGDAPYCADAEHSKLSHHRAGAVAAAPRSSRQTRRHAQSIA